MKKQPFRNICQKQEKILTTYESKLKKGVKQDFGLKCSAWKVFGSKDFGLVGL